jgi:hypothetical protein
MFSSEDRTFAPSSVVRVRAASRSAAGVDANFDEDEFFDGVFVPKDY